MKTIFKAAIVWTIVLVVVIATSSIAMANPPEVVGHGDGTTPFLCPAVGAGILNHMPDAGEIPNGNYTFLPGHNQAGAYANPNSFNTLSPGQSPGPGNGNSDWSPIWPQANPVP
jgi:hypothetical protein